MSHAYRGPVDEEEAFGEVTVEGNLPGLVPEAGELLMGDAVAIEDGHWTLTLPGS